MSPLLQQMRERRKAIRAELDAILTKVESRTDQTFSAAETAKFDQFLADIRSLDETIDIEKRRSDAEDRAAESRRAAGQTGISYDTSAHVGYEARTYRPDVPEVSFFRDMVASRKGDWAAAERLNRNNTEAGVEKRALGNTGATGGSFGEWAPPAWLIDQFVGLARAGRVTADQLHHEPLPEGVSTINIPRFTTGSSTAVQTTQNTAVSSTDPTTAYLSSGIVTIAGRNVISQQLLDQSAIPLDQVILADLAADYARQLDLQVISGSGSSGQLLGILNVSGITQVAYTQATPAVAGAGGFYATLNKAISAIATARFLPPTCIVMHPRRWSWVAASFDGQNRPLVAPSGNAFNQIADAGAVAAQGPAGQMAGLPVYLDANLPTNLGAGTNQDPVLVLRASDLYLWESNLRMATFDQPYSDSMGVLVRAHGYSSMIASRFPASIAVVNGTGTVTPTY